MKKINKSEKRLKDKRIQKLINIIMFSVVISGALIVFGYEKYLMQNYSETTGKVINKKHASHRAFSKSIMIEYEYFVNNTRYVSGDLEPKGYKISIDECYTVR
ncbi:MAG TPA: hypothetical protein DCQ31_03450, partial [Bacteroidales bacterium]|nr:hypothetical protein [Bacteroidales bacterium]